MINFIVDIREKEIIKLLTLLNINFIQKQLHLGDILFQNEQGQEILIIERKTVQDLKASICDGRWREQKMRLLNCGINVKRIMYIIEGDINKIHGISNNSILGSLINSMLRDDLKIYKTFDINETVDFIVRLNNKLEQEEGILLKDDTLKNTIPVEYSATLSKVKKDNLTPTVFYIYLLSNIPRISDNISKVIQSNFKSIDLLMDAFKDADEYLLKDLQYDIKNNKTRKIGKENSKRIYNYLFNK